MSKAPYDAMTAYISLHGRSRLKSPCFRSSLESSNSGVKCLIQDTTQFKRLFVKTQYKMKPSILFPFCSPRGFRLWTPLPLRSLQKRLLRISSPLHRLSGRCMEVTFPASSFSTIGSDWFFLIVLTPVRKLTYEENFFQGCQSERSWIQLWKVPLCFLPHWVALITLIRLGNYRLRKRWMSVSPLWSVTIH